MSGQFRCVRAQHRTLNRPEFSVTPTHTLRMFSINHEITESYACHPGFSVPQQPLDLDASLVDRFARDYAGFCAMGALLDPASQRAAGLELAACVTDIFARLRAQCSDEHEARFVEELQQQVGRLLRDELAWYGKPPAPHFVQLATEEQRQCAMQLRTDCHYFGRLSASAVATIQAAAAQTLAGLRANAAAGRLRRDDLSVNSGATVRHIRDLLNVEFKALGALDAVSAFIGRKTKVQGLALELSVPQATWWNNAIEGLPRPPGTLYAHVDEGISFPKSIVYLSNVDTGNGPTGCYPGAFEALGLNPLQELVGRVVGNVGSGTDSPLHGYYAKTYHQSTSSPGFRRHFMRLPPSMRFNSHLGWDVAPGSALETSLVEREKQMTGPAGTFVVFDGARLLHRGGLIQQGERVALQVVFSDITPVQRVMNKVRAVMQ